MERTSTAGGTAAKRQLRQLLHHPPEDGDDGVEALISLADVLQPGAVKEDLLDDEDGHGARQFIPRLHDAEAEGDDLGGEEEGHDGTRPVVKGAQLSGQNGILFRRNSLSGAIEAVRREGKGVTLNEALHA